MFCRKRPTVGMPGSSYPVYIIASRPGLAQQVGQTTEAPGGRAQFVLPHRAARLNRLIPNRVKNDARLFLDAAVQLVQRKIHISSLNY